MFEHSNNFMPLTILILILNLAIFAMKYAVQMLNARAEAATARDADHRLEVLEKPQATWSTVSHILAMLKEVE